MNIQYYYLPMTLKLNTQTKERHKYLVFVAAKIAAIIAHQELLKRTHKRRRLDSFFFFFFFWGGGFQMLNLLDLFLQS